MTPTPRPQPVSGRLPGRDAESGLSLIEVVVALSLVMVVMMPVTMLFVRSMSSTALQDQRQAAVALADEALELSRAVPATRLTDGRTATAVTAQLSARPTTAKLDDASGTLVRDGAATQAAPALDLTSLVGGVTYDVRTFVSRCYRPSVAAASCVATPTTSTPMFRVTASVSWVPGRRQNCTLAGGVCEVVASTLVDPTTVDPIFNVNAS
jgi:Tfp pilus assembly protein PilV